MLTPTSKGEKLTENTLKPPGTKIGFAEHESINWFNVVTLVATGFLITVGFASFNLLLPYYIMALKHLLTKPPERLETIPTHKVVIEIGVLTTSFMVTRTIFAFLSGGLSDSLGRKRLIIAGLILYVILGMLYATASSFEELVVLRAVQGIASAMVWPVAETMLVESVPPWFRNRAMSLYTMSLSLGEIIGPPVAAGAYMLSLSLVDGDVVTVLRTPFILISLCAIPCLLLSLRIRETLHDVKGFSKDALISSFRFFLEVPRETLNILKGFFINAFCSGLYRGMLAAVMITYVLEFITADINTVAMIYSVSALCGFLTAYPVARLADDLDVVEKRRLMLFLMVLMRVLIALVGFVRDVLPFTILMCLMHMAGSAAMPLIRVAEAEVIEARYRSRVFGIHQSFFNAGMIIGPILGSLVYHVLYPTRFLVDGPQATFMLVSLVGMIGVVALAVYYRPSSPIKNRG